VLVRTYAAETRQTRVTANLVNPGAMRTRMRARAAPGEDPITLPAPEELAPYIVEMALPDETRSGLIFDFTRKRWLTPQPPA
jgi:NAD(P)-dependent dehydrogenase (short-subunit alcohol dehydrogenase family)